MAPKENFGRSESRAVAPAVADGISTGRRAKIERARRPCRPEDPPSSSADRSKVSTLLHHLAWGEGLVLLLRRR